MRMKNEMIKTQCIYEYNFCTKELLSTSVAFMLLNIIIFAFASLPMPFCRSSCSSVVIILCFVFHLILLPCSHCGVSVVVVCGVLLRNSLRLPFVSMPFSVLVMFVVHSIMDNLLISVEFLVSSTTPPIAFSSQSHYFVLLNNMCGSRFIFHFTMLSLLHIVIFFHFFVVRI